MKTRTICKIWQGNTLILPHRLLKTVTGRIKRPVNDLQAACSWLATHIAEHAIHHSIGFQHQRHPIALKNIPDVAYKYLGQVLLRLCKMLPCDLQLAG